MASLQDHYQSAHHLSPHTIPPSEDYSQAQGATAEARGITKFKISEKASLIYDERLEKISNDLEKQRDDIDKIKEKNVGYLKINLLQTKSLRTPLDAVVEPDDSGFIARTVDIPLFGFGDDPIEAINALKCEIESLYNDLMEDDNFSEEWLIIKEFLKKRIIT